MDWTHPPRSDAELQLWKVYCAVNPDAVWSKIQIWIKTYGNPFIPCTSECYTLYEEHTLYQEALRHLIRHTK